MARMDGVAAKAGGWFTRLAFWMARRKLKQITGRAALVAPVKVTAHHPRLLMAMGQMEAGQEAAKSVPPILKSLALIHAATLIGCPY